MRSNFIIQRVMFTLFFIHNCRVSFHHSHKLSSQMPQNYPRELLKELLFIRPALLPTFSLDHVGERKQSMHAYVCNRLCFCFDVNLIALRTKSGCKIFFRSSAIFAMFNRKIFSNYQRNNLPEDRSKSKCSFPNSSRRSPSGARFLVCESKNH